MPRKWLNRAIPEQAASEARPDGAVASERLAVVIANRQWDLVATTNNRTEDSAMTDEMMKLRTLLEKSSDADLLRELGWIENRTVAIEHRWADGRTERYSEIAEEFVRLKIDVIVTTGTPIETTSEQGAIHGRGYNSRVRFGEACFPGARD